VSRSAYEARPWPAFNDPAIRSLLTDQHVGVLSTIDDDDTIHSTVVWVDLEGDDAVAVNRAVGRVWPANLERDPRATVLVYNQTNPLEYVEIRGLAKAATEGAEEQIDRLAKK
jgi:PPOX class probable F420-dependent enzyme